MADRVSPFRPGPEEQRSRRVREQVPMVDEEITQREPAPMDPRLHRTDRDARRLRDLDVLEPVGHVEQERDALLGDETSERLLEETRLFAPDERPMGIAGPINGRRERLFGQRIGAAAAMPALRVTAGIEHDPGDPASDAALAAVGARTAERAEKALLERILCEHGVTSRSDGKRVEEVLVAHDELIEGREIAASCGPEQCRIHLAARRILRQGSCDPGWRAR